jgi:hypothetical protein
MVIEFADHSDIVARLQAVEGPSIVELKDRLYGAARILKPDTRDLPSQQSMAHVPEQLFSILR